MVFNRSPRRSSLSQLAHMLSTDLDNPPPPPQLTNDNPLIGLQDMQRADEEVDQIHVAFGSCITK